MTKKIMQDVVARKTHNTLKIQVPTWETSVRRAPLEKKAPVHQPKTENKIIKEAQKDKFKLEEDIVDTLIATEAKNKKPKRRYGLWIIAFTSVLFLVFALSFLFSKAYIVINPKVQVASSAAPISAVKDSNTTSPSFDLVVISGQDTMEVEAEEKREIKEPARGKAVIYNTFSSAGQRLSIDTRLEGSNGKIYKTTKEVTVPGMKSGGTPGSVEVDIYASEAGESYNSAPLDFKIFGFKGTPKYEKFYARSTTSISGGLVGNLPFVSPELKATSVASLTNKLKSSLFKKISDQTPEGFILFEDAAFLSITEESVDYSNKEDTTVPIVLKGTLYGLLLNEQKLTKELAKKAIKDYDGSPVYIANINDLDFSLANKENISFADVKNITFSLKGDAKFVWKFDEEEFITNILGKAKRDFNSILEGYANIESANLNLRPFWRMSLPDKKEGLEIVVNYPN